VVVVDGTVRRPHYVFNPDAKTEDAYLKAQEADRTRIMTQNVGRILRGSGVKYVMVVGISPLHMTILAKEVGRLASVPTAHWFTPDDTDTAMAALVASVKAGKLVIPHVPEDPAKPRANMSRKQRAVADVTAGPHATVAADADRLAADMTKVAELANAGATWRTAARAVNASRQGRFFSSLIKQSYEAAKICPTSVIGDPSSDTAADGTPQEPEDDGHMNIGAGSDFP
jgi:hypothetical protein